MRVYSVAVSESVVVYLYAALSQHLQQAEYSELAFIHVSAQRNGGLLDRLVSVGCRAVRQTALMVYGEYVPSHRYVYCPSIVY